jgi:hypothetical protein
MEGDWTALNPTGHSRLHVRWCSHCGYLAQGGRSKRSANRLNVSEVDCIQLDGGLNKGIYTSLVLMNLLYEPFPHCRVLSGGLIRIAKIARDVLELMPWSSLYRRTSI